MDNYSEPLANGLIRIITVPDPAVASNWSTLLSANNTFEIICIRFRLVTDANAAARNIGIQLLQASNVLLELMYPIAQTASTTIDWSFYHGASDITNIGRGLGTGPLPPKFTVPGNFIIQSDIFNVQVGDQFSDIDIYLRRWESQKV